MQIDLTFQTTIYLIPSSYHIYGCDWWMMAGLLGVDGTAIDEALEGLTQDGVEGFLELEVHYGDGEGQGYAGFEALERGEGG